MQPIGLERALVSQSIINLSKLIKCIVGIREKDRAKTLRSWDVLIKFIIHHMVRGFDDYKEDDEIVDI